MTESRIKNTEYVWFHVTNHTQGVEKMKGLESCWTGHRFFPRASFLLSLCRSCSSDTGDIILLSSSWLQLPFQLVLKCLIEFFGSHVLYIHFLTSHSHLRNVLFSLARPRFTPGYRDELPVDFSHSKWSRKILPHRVWGQSG